MVHDEVEQGVAQLLEHGPEEGILDFAVSPANGGWEVRFAEQAESGVRARENARLRKAHDQDRGDVEVRLALPASQNKNWSPVDRRHNGPRRYEQNLVSCKEYDQEMLYVVQRPV